jgi:hypothetical protein
MICSDYGDDGTSENVPPSIHDNKNSAVQGTVTKMTSMSRNVEDKFCSGKLMSKYAEEIFLVTKL